MLSQQLSSALHDLDMVHGQHAAHLALKDEKINMLEKRCSEALSNLRNLLLSDEISGEALSVRMAQALQAEMRSTIAVTERRLAERQAQIDNLNVALKSALASSQKRPAPLAVRSAFANQEVLLQGVVHHLTDGEVIDRLRGDQEASQEELDHERKLSASIRAQLDEALDKIQQLQVRSGMMGGSGSGPLAGNICTGLDRYLHMSI